MTHDHPEAVEYAAAAHELERAAACLATPYRFSNPEQRGFADAEIVDSGGEHVAVFCHGAADHYEHWRRADFVLRACNSHEALIAALEIAHGHMCLHVEHLDMAGLHDSASALNRKAAEVFVTLTIARGASA